MTYHTHIIHHSDLRDYIIIIMHPSLPEEHLCVENDNTLGSIVALVKIDRPLRCSF